MKTPILLLLSTFFCTKVFSQTTYYVSPTGNDANAGTLAAPWKTFGKAATTAVAGNKVYFRGGIYNEKWINFSNSGTANNYIEFLNYSNETPVFDGGNANAYFILINNKNYIKINGLQFKKLIGNNSGIKIDGTSHHIEIRNCWLSELYFSANAADVPSSTQTFNPLVFAGSNATTAMSNIVVDNCKIFNCRTGYSEALTFVGNINGFSATNNQITNTGNIGIVAAGFYSWDGGLPVNSQARNGVISGNIVENCKSLVAIAAGIYVDGGKNIVVEQNICRGGQRGFQINCENHDNVANAAAENVIIRNNLAYNNSRGGIGLGTQSTGKVSNSWIINNTCVNNYVNQTELGANEDFGELNLDYSENCTIRNNIFFTNMAVRDRLMNSYPPRAAINLSSNYNVWFHTTDSTPYFVYNSVAYDGLTNFQSQTSKDLNSKFQNPNFVDVANNNFKLNSETSPAYDFSDPTHTVIDSTGTNDLALKTRMKNLLPDAGAYEFQCPTNDVSVNSILTYKSYLFETNGKIFFNKAINPNIQIIANAKKHIFFQNGFSKPNSGVFETRLIGCSN